MRDDEERVVGERDKERTRENLYLCMYECVCDTETEEHCTLYCVSMNYLYIEC